MRPLQATLAIVALLVAAVAIFLVSTQGETAYVTPLPEVQRESKAPDRVAPRSEPRPKGGVFAGVVVDEQGEPIAGATVLLVAFDAGDELPIGERTIPTDPEEFDPSLVPVIGPRTDAEGKTDAAGRFSIAADARSHIRIVAAYRMGYVPNLVRVRGPGEGIQVVLQRAGQFVGTVLDDETGDPVAGVKVMIFLQQKVLPPREGAQGAAGAVGRQVPLSPFATAQQWVVRELGQRVWGITPETDPGIPLWTDKKGTFRFGPIGNEVQLEFVLTHKDYMWTEFDQTKKGHAKRTVVNPGETAERTFRLRKGKHISGRVVDEETGRGVGDVLIEVEHVAQHAQHWFYRIKKRRTRTKRDGSFRVGGLSFGPYIAQLKHPSFGKEFVPSIPENAQGLYWEVRSLGGIDARVEGVDAPQHSRLQLVLEAVESDPQRARQRVYRPPVAADGTFRVSGVQPGRYRAWVLAANMNSQPVDVEVRSHETTSASFVLGGGGAIRIRVYDAGGRIVDPASVRLIRPAEGDEPEVALGRFVTRGGRLEATGIVPGRYEAEVTAAGFLPARSEAFEVTEDRVAEPAEVILRQQGFVKIVGVRGADGRAVAGSVHLFVKEPTDEAFRRLGTLKSGIFPAGPGAVGIRAEAQDGRRFESTVEVGDGETLPVEIVLR